jgi:phage-related protein
MDRRVWKLAEDYDGDTYRAAYTVALPGAVYVLHVFKKKSKAGVETPKPDREVIKARLAWAIEHHREHYE